MTSRCCALALLLLGCGAPTAPVTVHFTMASTAMPSPGTGYTGPTGTVGTNQDMQLVLDSKAGGAELKVSVDPPQQPGTITIGNAHVDVEYSLTMGGPTWVSNAGSITFQTVTSPYGVTFDMLEMIGSAATGAQGTFTLAGTGQFTK